MIISICYSLMIIFFITHELDAVLRHEWRLFPVLSSLPEPAGAQIFIWLHVPLFALLLLSGANDPTSGTAMALSAFSIIHVLLHWLFRNHVQNEFKTTNSWIIIVATGIFGILHLSMVL